MYCVVLQMFFVQPKSVQKCNLMYQPKVQAESIEVHSSIDGSFDDDVSSKDSDKHSTTSKDDVPPATIVAPLEPPKPNFASDKPLKESVSNEVLNTLTMLAKAQNLQQNPSVLPSILQKEEEQVEENKDGISTGSSPSREVEKILSLNENTCFDMYYDDPEGTQAPGSNQLDDDNDLENGEAIKVTGDMK